MRRKIRRDARNRAGFISHWQGIFEVPPPVVDAIQKETAETVLRKLIEQNEPRYAPAAYILAVMLERKRILKVKEQIVRDGRRVFIYEQPKTGDIFTIADPNLRLDQLEEVQRDVAMLLEQGVNPPCPPLKLKLRRTVESVETPAHKFMIYDLRFMIAGGSAGCVENFCQFPGLGAQFGQTLEWQQSGAFSQFNPKRRLVRFFKNYRDFVDEICARFSAQGRAIIRRHRTAAARNLICDGRPETVLGIASAIFKIRTANSIVRSLSSSFVMIVRFSNVGQIINHSKCPRSRLPVPRRKSLAPRPHASIRRP